MSKANEFRALYKNRRLSDGYPTSADENWKRWREEHHDNLEGEQSPIGTILHCLDKLIDLSAGRKPILVVGCGPDPHTLKYLLKKGYDAVGVEPIPEYVISAGEKAGDPGRVVLGSAENLPFEANSQAVVLLESVLEHVESPIKTLDEIFRILMPGGVAFIYTTNRYHFSITGENGEFRTPFYNWFPNIVKESFVFEQLHYRPSLGNFTPRPAVHWFCYSDLCKLGREAGFAKFYSFLHLVEPNDSVVARSRLRVWLLNRIRYNPWLRGLALLQVGSSIFMLKRP